MNRAKVVFEKMSVLSPQVVLKAVKGRLKSLERIKKIKPVGESPIKAYAHSTKRQLGDMRFLAEKQMAPVAKKLTAVYKRPSDKLLVKDVRKLEKDFTNLNKNEQIFNIARQKVRKLYKV